MASTIMRRPSLPPVPAQSRTDEELINKSLLDSLDEQADAEPLSSDSEAPTATTGSGSGTSSSVTSPSGPYRSHSMHSQLSRPDSPTYTKSAHGYDPYLQHMQSPGQSLYNNNHPIMTSQEDVTPRQLDKIGLAPSSFRASNSYGSLANGRVHEALQPPTGFRSFQDAITASYAADNQSQTPHPGRPGQPVDAAAASARRYDFMNGPPGVQHKASFGTLESFPPSGQQPNTAGPKVGTTTGPRQHGGYHAPSQAGFGGTISAMQSTTPFGPHLPAVGGPPGVGSVAMGPVSGPTQTTQQEEISTIFVVGFPDDMQEREFQNMFTFSPGFEAATLKIPNKELTSYGPGSAGLRSAGFGNFGQNDPYNLVTMNQGGVLVDNGRDGTTTSWGAGHDDGHFGNGPSMTPRKQIIGFAKFRTRQEALDAREVLQGRRVDAEKGAVLKAEMAKKNLHTKRGVGQPGMPNSAGGPMNGSDALAGYSGLNGLGSPGGPGEALTARERELGALGAMGFGALAQRRDRLSEDERNMMQMQGMMGTRGARERAEEDERDRERRRREQELKLRNSNSSAFDAFHSVPQQMGRNAPPNPLLASTADDIPARFNMSSFTSQDSFGMNSGMDPWTQPPRELVSAGGPMRKVPSSLNSATFGMHHMESHQGSPTHFDEFPSGPNSTSSQDGFDSDAHSNPDTGPFSPPLGHQPVTLLKRGAHVFRPRAASPAAEHGHGQPHYAQPPSSASSTSGSSQIGQDEFAGAIAGLNLNGPHGDGSPQLPSPVSNTSSGSGQQKGNVDQNPPINTLYVGNLPSSPLLSYSNHLEESLKALFARCQGFRKLCFRQKANGPMCFVEFEDVHFATKALNDLYGHTLDGMIKNGGIRLSYSKNPLGVRPPNSGNATNGSQLQAQQSISSQTSPYLADAFVPRGIPGRAIIDNVSTPVPRKDTLELPRSPPAGGYNFGLAAPQQPPRFASSSPNAATFANANAAVPFSSTAFPRANPPGFSLPPPGTTGVAQFSSFGLPAGRRATDAALADNNDRLMHALPPLTT